MIEFKFSCPSCGQHIQATDAYSGMQIHCPSCQKPIEVPRPAGSAPAAAQATPPAPPAHSASPHSPPAQKPPSLPIPQQAAPVPQKPKGRWLVIGVTFALIAAGAITFALLSTSQSSDKPKSPSHKTAAAARKEFTAPIAAEPKILTAAEIMQKVVEQYASMTNYSGTGTAVSLMDMSKVDPKKMPGMDRVPASAKGSKEIKDALSIPIKTETDFSIKLGRADFYRVEWETKSGVAAAYKSAAQTTMKGAAWSVGDGDFLSPGNGKYTKMQTRELSLATAAGLSGGATASLPSIFFGGQANPLALFTNAEQGEDQSIDGEDCYVINTDTMGIKTIFWVAKSSFLIKQKQVVFGGKSTIPEVSDAEMDKSLKDMSHLTPEQKAQAKLAAKSMKPMLSKMKGTLTETYLNIEINKALKKEDFQYPIPAGTTLSPTLY